MPRRKQPKRPATRQKPELPTPPALASANGSEAAVKLEIAMDALEDISNIPRAGRAGRLARAVLRFLQCVKPVSFDVVSIKPPNAALSGAETKP